VLVEVVTLMNDRALGRMTIRLVSIPALATPHLHLVQWKLEVGTCEWHPASRIIWCNYLITLTEIVTAPVAISLEQMGRAKTHQPDPRHASRECHG
jgi:hypothetical protein